MRNKRKSENNDRILTILTLPRGLPFGFHPSWSIDSHLDSPFLIEAGYKKIICILKHDSALMYISKKTAERIILIIYKRIINRIKNNPFDSWPLTFDSSPSTFQFWPLTLNWQQRRLVCLWKSVNNKIQNIHILVIGFFDGLLAPGSIKCIKFFECSFRPDAKSTKRITDLKQKL